MRGAVSPRAGCLLRSSKGHQLRTKLGAKSIRDMRAAEEAFQAFDHGDKGYLDKHGVKCALLALTGRLPCKACSTVPCC